jgi:hypothetical protein
VPAYQKLHGRTGVSQGDRRDSGHCAILVPRPFLARDLLGRLMLLLPTLSLGLGELLFRR